MKSKTLIIFIIVIIILIPLAFICYHFYQSNFAPAEIVAKPDTQITYYKGINIIPYEVKDGEIDEVIEDIKDLGVNIVVINLDLFISDKDEFELNTGSPDLDLERQIAQVIAEAHKQGLHTELRTVTGSPMMMDAGKVSYAKILSEAKEFVSHWAQFAQGHDVLQFTLFGEVNSLRANCISDFEPKIPEFSKEMLSEAQKHYNGKIGMGFLHPDDELNHDLSGYDYIEISIYVHEGGLYEDYEDGFTTQVENVQPLLAKSNIDTLIMGETGVSYDSVTGQSGFDIEVTESVELEYYQTLFNTISSKLNGMYVGYDCEEKKLRISNGSTEDLIKRQFGTL